MLTEEYTHDVLDFIDGELPSFFMFSPLLVVCFQHNLAVVCLFLGIVIAPFDKPNHCTNHRTKEHNRCQNGGSLLDHQIGLDCIPNI